MTEQRLQTALVLCIVAETGENQIPRHLKTVTTTKCRYTFSEVEPRHFVGSGSSATSQASLSNHKRNWEAASMHRHNNHREKCFYALCKDVCCEWHKLPSFTQSAKLFVKSVWARSKYNPESIFSANIFAPERNPNANNMLCSISNWLATVIQFK